MRRALVFFALWPLLGAAQAKPELPKLTLGTIFPMTGPQAAFGKEALRGITVASELLTKKDPDLATRIAIASGDDLSTSKDAAAAAEKMANDRTHVIMGSLTSSASAAIAAVARKYQMPMVSPLATQTTLTAGTPVFRSCFDEVQQADILANFALTVLNIKTAATLRDDTLTAHAFTDRFAATFRAGGGQIVADQIYDLASDDYKVPLKALEATGVKLVATPAAYQTAALLMTQAKTLNTKLMFLGGESWDTKELGRLAGARAKDHYFVSHFAVDDPNVATQEFVTAFKAKYGRAPGTIAALTFDAFNLIAQAFKTANTNMKGPLTQALLKTRDFAGVTGDLAFGDAGETWKAGIVKQTSETDGVFKARVLPRLTATTPAPAPPGGVPSASAP